MNETQEILSKALDELTQVARSAPKRGGPKGNERDKGKGKAPLERELLRRFLLALGELVSSDLEVDLGAELTRARQIIEQLGERWGLALEAEMQLACGEHIQGVDPRYLGHPRYDFQYTLEARQRLEQRFEALAALEQPIDPQLVARVADADERLADELEKRSAGPGEG